LEKFIATNNPARGPLHKCVCRGDSTFNAAKQHRALAAQFQWFLLQRSYDVDNPGYSPSYSAARAWA
jgi:hypothetical protein